MPNNRVPKGEPLLSARWVNKRTENVYMQAMDIMNNLIDQVVYSGYLPFEAPPDIDFVKRLSPEEKVKHGLEEPEQPEVDFAEGEMNMPMVSPDMIDSLPPVPQPLADSGSIL
jgi:hypothetical protein